MRSVIDIDLFQIESRIQSRMVEAKAELAKVIARRKLDGGEFRYAVIQLNMIISDLLQLRPQAGRRAARRQEGCLHEI